MYRLVSEQESHNTLSGEAWIGQVTYSPDLEHGGVILCSVRPLRLFGVQLEQPRSGFDS